ncbi:hypothetical protein [Streptomyces sp. NBC_00154]|uniref:hypothetical protein n=1 Tax=Streptomyces sp. NBC_00154 TaxID=2975670 RepID=UPI00225172AF|nr:hypothetical protein [Streptomyces sp. NBC_00154]MCX5310062.1 hypothetical protein [Streptomyces sp. NBC_00154]
MSGSATAVPEIDMGTTNTASTAIRVRVRPVFPSAAGAAGAADDAVCVLLLDLIRANA